MLRQVGIPAPEKRYDQFPHELSGGMKQRVLTAMAMAAEAETSHRGRTHDGARRDDTGADTVASFGAVPQGGNRARDDNSRSRRRPLDR